MAEAFESVEQLMEAFHSGGTEKARAFKEIYNRHIVDCVYYMMKVNRGDKEEALDIYHEAMLIFEKKEMQAKGFRSKNWNQLKSYIINMNHNQNITRVKSPQAT